MIDIQNISFNYAGQKTKVFDNFSLQLTENNIYGLLGKNGTGKSTLLYLVSGLLRPCKGTVKVDGMESALRRPEMLEELFIVPEEFELPNMTLEKYVSINQPFYPRFSREVLQNCLNDFELPASLSLQSLSMGQKKKVFMSFALAAGTRLLLMDEPTNGLDIPSKVQFRRVVANNMTDDRTLIISTHQVHDVESLLDHILILSNEKLLLDASVADICEQYSFEYRTPGATDDDVLYSEPSVQGNAVITRRTSDMTETPLNLELLFNAVTLGKVNGNIGNVAR
ncbi:MAG: ABC transporter ATP-binding protein [Prevotella sp.]|nr:ABC transporter ATP-binding protein [Prevotella sp.]